MLHPVPTRVARKLLTLGVMVACLTVLVTDFRVSNKASAQQGDPTLACMDSCGSQYSSCRASCVQFCFSFPTGEQICFGPDPSACMSQCDSSFQSCLMGCPRPPSPSNPSPTNPGGDACDQLYYNCIVTTGDGPGCIQGALRCRDCRSNCINAGNTDQFCDMVWTDYCPS